MGLVLVNAGQLRHRIAIVRPEANPEEDDYGQPQGAPATVRTCWARVRSLSGKEAEEKRQLAAEATHEVLMRYFDDVEPSDQVVFDGRTFEIAGPPRDPDNRKIALVLLCKEAANE
jgi:SPP1 family predicted phage head-tail adaptor